MRADEAHQQELEHREYLELCQKILNADEDYEKWLDQINEATGTNPSRMVG